MTQKLCLQVDGFAQEPCEETHNDRSAFSGVAHDQTDLVLLDMLTNRRTIVRAGGPGSRGFSPLFLGDDSVYLPLLGGYLARVSFTRP